MLVPALAGQEALLEEALADAANRVAGNPPARGALADALAASAARAAAAPATGERRNPAPTAPGAAPSDPPRSPGGYSVRLRPAPEQAPPPDLAAALDAAAQEAAAEAPTRGDTAAVPPVPNAAARGSRRPAPTASARPPASPPAEVASSSDATGPRTEAPSPRGAATSELPFGDLLDDIDDGFDRIVQHPSTSATGASAEDLREVHQLFREIAATHMGPVRDFMTELKLGEPPREWLDLVLPAVQSLRSAAARMGLADLGEQLDGYIASLEAAVAANEPRLGAPSRERLTSAYAGLVSAMPEAFGLDGERDRREPIIVQSLLRQVPEVRKVALDKLYAAGLTNLSMYYVAKPLDIAAATGLSVEVATRIVERFARYRSEAVEVASDPARSGEQARLEALTRRLAEQNEQFESASRGRSREAADEKRRLRSERIETMLQINVLLARLGEIELVGQLERLPFAAKVEALDEHRARPRAKLSSRSPAGKAR